MTRIGTIKRLGRFPEELCPKCFQSPNCDLCNDTARFQQRLKPDWQLPKLNPGECLVAYCDNDSFRLMVTDRANNPVRDAEWPFVYPFASEEHLTTLGFKIEI